MESFDKDVRYFIYKNFAETTLIAMAVALKVGCTNCILAQTEKALAEGATRDEILETLQVLVAMGVTTGIADSLRVIKFLDELGHL